MSDIKLKVGYKVKHRAFGLGTIIGISTKPDDNRKSMFKMLIDSPNIVLEYINNPCFVSRHNLEIINNMVSFGCKCKPKDKGYWRVMVRKGNYSHFEAPKGCFHSSDYSTVVCLKCGQVGRTKANYVDELKDYQDNEINKPPMVMDIAEKKRKQAQEKGR